ncbi:protein yellow-like [Arctopsyche grandis]|uniref:protein yellow-like n=1 Tax=Arctopsyche grandis TaxID=121162 RepID=UPI00406D73C1
MLIRLQSRCFQIFLLCFHATLCMGMDNLRVAFEWKQLDFAYPNEQMREEAIKNEDFIPENNIPVGLEVSGERLFVTVPRWKPGVPASLTYVPLNDTNAASPKLIPYPNWSAHRFTEGNEPELVSPFRVRADRCDRLWVLDSGLSDLLGNVTVVSQPQLVVYDLRTDQLMRRFTIPPAQLEEESFFANIAVEDTSCEDSYAYAADLGSPGLVVYSWRYQTSWRVKHHYFHPDPLSGDFNVTGINFQWEDALFGLGLSAPGSDGFSTLYFHPLASTNEFSVSTKILRNESLANSSFDEFKLLGNRGPNAQSNVEFVDKSTGVLFYALVNLNAVACWKTTNKAYTIESQGRIYMSNLTMVFPNDIKVDDKGNLWVLSDRLPTFMYSKLDSEDVNFRILTASVKDAIRGTACDSKPNIEMIKKFANDTLNKLKKLGTSNSALSNTSYIQTVLLFVVSIFILS